MSTTHDLVELPAQYDPGQTERAIYERWVEAGIFSADETRSRRNGGDRDPFVIVMPPPNVTAVLHMGHGLNNTVQDVIIRWRRMVGDEALWVPGTDHAGIATQNIIEKQLAARAKRNPTSVGRHSSSARSRSWGRRAARFCVSCARSARRLTGIGRRTRFLRSFRAACAKRSSNFMSAG